MKTVDYSYAFAPPHRLTLSRPSGSFKVLADLSSETLALGWSFHTVMDCNYNTFHTPELKYRLNTFIKSDGEAVKISSWRRTESAIPAFHAQADGNGVHFDFYGIMTKEGAAVRVNMSVENGVHQVDFNTALVRGAWFMNNPSWIDGKYPNTLCCQFGDRADRLLLTVIGADAYIVPTWEMMSPNKDDPNAKCMVFSKSEVSEKQNKTLYLIVPRDHGTESGDVEKLKSMNWEALIADAETEWKTFVSAHCRLQIPDETMSHAFRAAFSDLFVMREQIADGEYSVTCGTQVYRAPNDCEPIIADIVFERMGFAKEVEEDLPVHMGGFGADGNWNSPSGWMARMWITAAMKCKLAYAHYELTDNKDFLSSVYPRMRANAHWQRKMRLSTLNDKNPSCRGLMPRGMGDCGLKDGNDFFGVFYPHNCYAILSDRITAKAAKILGFSDDAAEISAWVTEAENALIASLRAEAVNDGNGSVHIPSGPTAKTGTSRFGALLAYMTDILEFADPLIQGTLKWLESDLSEGGLPLNLGWLKNGLWVAIALDEISAAYLKAGLGDNAVNYLYPTVNHASPFTTWCEERGKEPSSTSKTGDMEHLWTPVALCRYLLDALCFTTENGLRLASGTPREWLEEGKTLGITGLRVPGGAVIEYTIAREKKECLSFFMHTDKPEKLGVIELALRLPEQDFRIADIAANGCTVREENRMLILSDIQKEAALQIELCF